MRDAVSLSRFDSTGVLVAAGEALAQGISSRLARLDIIFNQLHDASFAPVSESRRDAFLVQQIHKHVPNAASKFPSTTHFHFEHFAGDLIYTVEGFCEANRDDVHVDARTLLEHAALLRPETPVADSGDGKWSRSKSIGLKFLFLVKELSELLDDSDSTMFIRCLRPNSALIPGSCVRDHICRQLKHGGIEQIVTAVKYGFPVRKDFVELKRLLLTSAENYSKVSLNSPKMAALPAKKEPSLSDLSDKMNDRDFVETALHYLAFGSSKFQVGIRKVFFRNDGFEDFMLSLKQAGQTAWDISRFNEIYRQRVIRGRLTRIFWILRFGSRLRRVWSQRKSATLIQKCVRGWQERRRYARRISAILRIQRWWRRNLLRQLVLRRLIFHSLTPETLDGGPSPVEMPPEASPSIVEETSALVEAPSTAIDVQCDSAIIKESVRNETATEQAGGVAQNQEVSQRSETKGKEDWSKGRSEAGITASLGRVRTASLRHSSRSRHDSSMGNSDMETESHSGHLRVAPKQRDHKFERKIARDRVMLDQIAKLRQGEGFKLHCNCRFEGLQQRESHRRWQQHYRTPSWDPEARM
eukprot:Gregarina_sp_Poly_1__8676@NODE_516_length_7810_cov_96_902622_g410_i0_p2_GENE_NODE_516_length_7810_cov_96_902622_g410_i0NODE_516_length_7810_cov_96_902622_g410_i0_p2_ORF_typecomplete_len624_score90_68Myosin_head/PF00063_21/5_2e29IQ/PF00612_27/85IQ/PF00612_27/0_00013IQ/PF00612_27/0_68_NODE_516_length_7810_cov_96_902622_g410_i01241872